jgi:hypothetical protein
VCSERYFSSRSSRSYSPSSSRPLSRSRRILKATLRGGFLLVRKRFEFETHTLRENFVRTGTPTPTHVLCENFSKPNTTFCVRTGSPTRKTSEFSFTNSLRILYEFFTRLRVRAAILTLVENGKLKGGEIPWLT